ncbi:MAG: RNA polymerase sigma factor [Candidatus Moraniibacteriota bacterium]|nr:MAG: RNA polymerase sigma factor [Candidatus Moranbacteria bacterium]
MAKPDSNYTEDTVLIEAYRSGNEAAFKQLLDKHIGSVYAFVFQLLRDRTVAEDIVQETFIKAWRHLDRYDTARPFRTWLFAIAKNAAYDWLKKKRSLPFSAFVDDTDGSVPFESIPDLEPLPDEFLMRADASTELAVVIAALPEKYRALIALVYQEGFSLHEAAEILQEPYNTVKSRHQRSILELRNRLKGASDRVDGA